jgi:hypothetical protein
MIRIQIAIVAIIATEELIAAIAADHDFDVRACEPRDVIGAKRQGIGGLIEMPYEIREELR